MTSRDNFTKILPSVSEIWFFSSKFWQLSKIFLKSLHSQSLSTDFDDFSVEVFVRFAIFFWQNLALMFGILTGVKTDPYICQGVRKNPRISISFYKNRPTRFENTNFNLNFDSCHLSNFSIHIFSNGFEWSQYIIFSNELFFLFQVSASIPMLDPERLLKRILAWTIWGHSGIHCRVSFVDQLFI